MGPGILFKSVLQGSFSLMVFGWAQIVMDIQPLMVLITGEGHLHGFSHTYIGATLLSIVAALTGKYLSQFGLWFLNIRNSISIPIRWWVVFISAFIGCYSHVFIDSIMHSDLHPFNPISLHNPFLGWVSIITLHKLCLYSGVVGALIYYSIQWLNKKMHNKF